MRKFGMVKVVAVMALPVVVLSSAGSVWADIPPTPARASVAGPAGAEDEKKVARDIENLLRRYQADSDMDEQMKAAVLERRLLASSAQSQTDWYLQNLGNAVALTVEQKKAIADIIEARTKALGDFDSKNAEKQKAVTFARLAAIKQDQATLAKAREDYEAFFASRNEILKKSAEDVDKVLTKGQKDKLEEARAMDFVRELTAPAKLTADQAKQVNAAWAEDDGRNRRAVMELLPQILTPEQQATIRSARAMAFLNRYFSKAKLTEEQLQKVKAASERLSKDGTLGDVERLAKLTIQTKALLTEEQKEAMKPAATQAGASK